MILEGVAALDRVAAALAAVARAGDIVLLGGALGAGKTSLARGIVRALGHAGDVPSPTFTLVETYRPPAVRLAVWHVDLYRLTTADEVAALALDEADDALLLVEWPERLGQPLPAAALRLHLDGAGGTSRRLTSIVPPAWASRWPPR